VRRNINYCDAQYNLVIAYDSGRFLGIFAPTPQAQLYGTSPFCDGFQIAAPQRYSDMMRDMAMPKVSP